MSSYIYIVSSSHVEGPLLEVPLYTLLSVIMLA